MQASAHTQHNARPFPLHMNSNSNSREAATAGAGRAPGAVSVPAMRDYRERNSFEDDEDVNIASGLGVTSPRTTSATALPGIRDLFPDHLFEELQDQQPHSPRRARDPFLPSSSAFSPSPSLTSTSASPVYSAPTSNRNAYGRARAPAGNSPFTLNREREREQEGGGWERAREDDREMQREAFDALAGQRVSPSTPREGLYGNGRGGRAQMQGGFTFPAQQQQQQQQRALGLSNELTPSATPTSASFPASARPPPSNSSFSTSTVHPSSSINQTAEPRTSPPARSRSKTHAHSLSASSDTSVAAAGLLGLSLSGPGAAPFPVPAPPVPKLPAEQASAASTNGTASPPAPGYRAWRDALSASEAQDSYNGWGSGTLGERMEMKREDSEDEDEDAKEADVEGMEVDTAPTSVDSHADAPSTEEDTMDIESKKKEDDLRTVMEREASALIDRGTERSSPSSRRKAVVALIEPFLNAQAERDAQSRSHHSPHLPERRREPKQSASNEGERGEESAASASVENDNDNENEVSVENSAENDDSVENEGEAEAEGEAEGEGEGIDGKRHTCPHCRKRFNRPSSLKIHLNTHTGAKPFECPFQGCGRQFNVSSNMRRHYRNHSQNAGMGGVAVPPMGMVPTPGMIMHEHYGQRHPPQGVLGLHAGPSGYPNASAQHMQSERENLEHERSLERLRDDRRRAHWQGPSKERYPPYMQPPHSNLQAPSAYRAPQSHPLHSGAPPHMAGMRLPPPLGMQHGPQYKSYPPVSHEAERRMEMIERENQILRERERQREQIELDRRQRERMSLGYPPQQYSQPQPHQHPASSYPRGYSQQSPPQRELRMDYRSGDPVAVHIHQPYAQGGPPPGQSGYASSRSQSQYPPPPPFDAQPRAPTLRPSQSFSHPYAAAHGHPYARGPSHSQSRSRERYSSGAGSPVRSPAMSAASSLPTRGWRGHSHTHSAPAFAGPRPDRVELPPIVTSVQSPYARDAALPNSHGRSQSYSVSNATDVPPLPEVGRVKSTDFREEERIVRRERRDSTQAWNGHESELEGIADSASDFDGEPPKKRRASSDVDMGDAVGTTRDRNGREVIELDRDSEAVTPGSAARRESRNRARPEATSPLVPVSSVNSTRPASPSEMQRTPSLRSIDSRRSGHSQTPSSSSIRDRAYSHSHQSHSRTGSSSSSGHGHGHGFNAHPYARARHAHSQSREAAMAADAISPSLSTSMPMSPLAGASASTSSHTSAVASAVSSPRQTQGNRDSKGPLRETNEADKGSKITSPVSTGNSRFPMYTFPPPAPPPSAILSVGGRTAGADMEVEDTPVEQ